MIIWVNPKPMIRVPNPPLMQIITIFLSGWRKCEHGGNAAYPKGEFEFVFRAILLRGPRIQFWHFYITSGKI